MTIARTIAIASALAAFAACLPQDPGKGGGESCATNSECNSGCCYETTEIHPFCTSAQDHCMGSGSGSSSSSSSGSTSSSSGSTGGTAYVEFVEDFSKFGVAPGQVVQYIEAEGRSFVPEPIAGGTGKCSAKTTFKGTLTDMGGSPDAYVVDYTIYVRNYDSLDAHVNGQEYSNEEYAGGFRIDSLKPGCNTFEVAERRTGGLYLAPL